MKTLYNEIKGKYPQVSTDFFDGILLLRAIYLGLNRNRRSENLEIPVFKALKPMRNVKQFTEETFLAGCKNVASHYLSFEKQHSLLMLSHFLEMISYLKLDGDISTFEKKLVDTVTMQVLDHERLSVSVDERNSLIPQDDVNSLHKGLVVEHFNFRRDLDRVLLAA